MNEAEARHEQRRLAGQVKLGPPRPLPDAVCGVDVSYASASETAVAAAVVVATDTLEVLEQTTVVGTATFEYVPGLLSFRELPLVLEALATLTTPPELIVADGHGYAHPDRLGLASHLGVVTGIPTIGCAKSAFVGTYTEPSHRRGSWSEIVDDGEVVGQVVRTRDGVKPVYVSAGHLIDVESSRLIVLALTGRYRLPETTRQADQASRRHLGRVLSPGSGQPS